MSKKNMVKMSKTWDVEVEKCRKVLVEKEEKDRIWEIEKKRFVFLILREKMRWFYLPIKI